MTQTHPIAAAYDQALTRCGQAAAAVEEAERVLLERYAEYEEAHAALNEQHEAMLAAELFHPRRLNRPSHEGLEPNSSETVNERRRRRLPGFDPRGFKKGRWDDDEDETTD